MFWRRPKAERPAPLNLTEPEPYSLEISFPNTFGQPMYIEKERYHHAWFNYRPPVSEWNQNYRPFHFNTEIHQWCRSNLTRPWKAYYKYPREDGYYYIALSSYTDALLFRIMVSEYK